MTTSRGTAVAGVMLLAVLLATGCSRAELGIAPPPAPSAAGPVALPGGPAEGRMQGSVTVAYADVPASWVAATGDDVAAADLAHLWGLPLFRLDEHGQLQRGVVESFEETTAGDEFVVTLRIAEGNWSDGRAVTGLDVVATIDALTEAGHPPHPGLTSATAEGQDVTLRFVGATTDWPYLLLQTGGVLPAHVLAESGLEAYADGIPVSGGLFILEEALSGRSARFVAHSDGPLGTPGLEAIEVLFVPRYEAALGFLANGTVDLTLGHLALNPGPRATELDDVSAAAPLGGTVVALEVQRTGRLADLTTEERRDLLTTVQVAELAEGLLGDNGGLATSVFPERDGPFGEEVLGVVLDTQAVLLVPRWHEVIGFTARSLERDLESHQVTTDLVAEETPFFTTSARSKFDAVLRIRRDPPVPRVQGFLNDGDVPSTVLSHQLGDLDALIESQAWVRPLYQAAPAHVWSTDLEGVRPSAWPGLGFWNVGEWTRSS